MRSMWHRTWPTRSTWSWTIHPRRPIPLALILESWWTLRWRSVPLMHWRTLRPRGSWWASHVHRSRHWMVVGRPHTRRHIRTHSHAWWTTRSIGSPWASRSHRTSRTHWAHAHIWRRGSRWTIRLTLGRWSRSRFLLAFKLIQRLFRRQCNNRILTVQLLFRQTLHHVTHTILRAQRDHAKSLGLPIGTVFEKLDLLEIIDAHFRYCIGDILVRRPPG